MSFFSWEILVPFGAFLALAFAAWGGLTAVAETRGRVAQRLDRLMQGSVSRTAATSLLRSQARIQALVSRAAPTLSKPLQPKTEEEFGKIRLALLNAGFRSEQAVHIYLGIKFLLMLAGLAVAVPLAYAKYGLSSIGVGFMLLGTIVGCYLPNVVLGYIKKKRQEAIFCSLPDALDLMVVCVEAGLGLDSAMRRVTAEMADSSPVLCEEYALSNFQLQMGRPRRDVLHELGTRTGVNDLRALAAVLIQAERFGSSVATALRVQSDSMRTRRRQLAEERAAKTAVQLIFPLVLFIFPGIFVVLVGPAAIQIINSLFK